MKDSLILPFFFVLFQIIKNWWEKLLVVDWLRCTWLINIHKIVKKFQAAHWSQTTWLVTSHPQNVNKQKYEQEGQVSHFKGWNIYFSYSQLLLTAWNIIFERVMSFLFH